jgi:tetratricopeptide (TPR) repeat protein
MSKAERAALLTDLATCELRLGALDGAREFAASALMMVPGYRRALELQTELAGADPHALAAAKRALIAAAGSDDEKARLLTEIGDLHAERLHDGAGAVAAWSEALELRPRDHKLLHKCLDTHVAARAWPAALELLERLIAVEEVTAVRAKYRHAAALIWRDELGRPDHAAAQLRQALDDDPTLERAAVALEPLYQGAGAWRELSQLYRRWLKTLGPESPGDADGHNHERLRIWGALGELFADKLDEPETARAALEVALALDRGNLERRKRFADVCAQARAVDQAIAEHQTILHKEKSRVASYRALKQLYGQGLERDKALACAAALVFLGQGDAEDNAHAAEARKLPFATAHRPLGDDGWARLVHPDEDRLLDRLFLLVGPTVVAAQAQPHKGHGLVRKEQVGPGADRSYAKALAYVTSTLDVARPEAYVRPEQREPVVFVACVDGRELVPVFLLGSPLVGERRNEVEQVFELARRAAHLRPERLLRLALPHAQPVAQVIEAAMALAEGGARGGLAAALERSLPPPQLAELQAIGGALRQAGVRADEAAAQWWRATDLTGSRVGLALAGELAACARLLASENQPVGTAPTKERLLDLAWSSVTEELFTVRRGLGLVV